MAMLSRQAWSRFWTLTRPLFRSEERWRAIALLSLLVTLLLSVSGLNVVNSFVGRDFMTSIEQQQAGRFWHLALLYLSVFGLSTLVAVFCRYTEERLGLLWRSWLTTHLSDRYLAGHAYYRMIGRGDIDNPDQRIAEDVKVFTTTSLSFILIFLNSAITLAAFSGILWSITPWLFVAAVAYAFFGSFCTMLLGGKLVPLDVLQLQKEADYRYELIRVRENAERIALLRGERQERVLLRRRLDAIVGNFKRIVAVNRNIGFFTVGYNYLIQLVPLVIVAPLYVRGDLKQFGTVTQAAMAFSHVMGAFSIIVVEFQRITSFAAVITRLGSFWEAVGQAAADDKSPIEVVEDEDRLAFEGLTLVTPAEGRLLVKDLSLEVPHGKRLLISGPRGAGRSSLLRATAGLWRAGAGRIHRPAAGEVMFLPQQPYLVDGTLRDQLLYCPADEKDLTDDRLLTVLRKVGLERLLERVGGLDARRCWTSVLSRGEQQQLAFARLLLTVPRFAFLDEATSGLDAEDGRRLYETLAQTPISYVSVASDPALAEHHDLMLEIEGGGPWRMVPRAHAVSA
jgi:putative ATP-binding cassette transporter